MKKLVLALDGEAEPQSLREVARPRQREKANNPVKEGGAAHECQANERIEKMRATIQKERQAVADLSSKAPDLKPQLLDVTSA